MNVEDLGKEFPLDSEYEEAFKAKELSDAAKAAIEKAVKILSKWKDDMPADCVKALGVLTKAAGLAYGAYPAKSKKEEELEKENAELKAQLSPEARKKEISAEARKLADAEIEGAVNKAVAKKEEELVKESLEAFDEVLAEKVG